MDEYTTYEGYQLDDVYTWELSDSDIDLLDAAIYLVDNRCTIRQVCKNFGKFKRATLQRHIHTKLRCLSFELYRCVCRVLKHNMTKKVGGTNFVKRH